MIEKLCKGCGEPFPQFNTIQNLCNDCAFTEAKLHQKKRKSLNPKGKISKQWMDEDRPHWIKNHPPDEYGYWSCYLQIHDYCPRRINITRLNLDHVIPRSHDPSKRRKMQNLRPCCKFCNGLKGSQSLERIKKLYPNSLVAREG